MVSKTDYPKKIISLDKQIEQLQERGLVIENITRAKYFLRNISYYRLQGFWWEFQSNKVDHKFIKGTTFDQIIDLYTFDRKLRLLLFDAIDRIEIALRTKLIYYLSIELDQWWFEDPNNFYNSSFFEDTLEDIDKELERTKEVFIKKHYDNYGIDNRPPAYKTLEILPFGCLSKLYSNLSNSITAKNRIAKEFNLPNNQYLSSWLKSLNIIRNIIAHHARLWNRKIRFAPKYLHKTDYNFIDEPNNKHSIYHNLSCILFLLNKVSPGHSLKGKLVNLIEENNFINLEEMGIPNDWREQDIWK